MVVETVGNGEHFLHQSSVTVQFRTLKVSVGRKSSYASTSPEQGGLCEIEHRTLVQYFSGTGEFFYHRIVPAPSSQVEARSVGVSVLLKGSNRYIGAYTGSDTSLLPRIRDLLTVWRSVS